jgi:hypothetical protein
LFSCVNQQVSGLLLEYEANQNERRLLLDMSLLPIIQAQDDWDPCEWLVLLTYVWMCSVDGRPVT